MKSPSSLSVVIPCYNDGQYLTPIVNQIKKSKLVGEIIVIDDGSRQETKNILGKIKGINLITNPQNIGKSKTLKKGVLAANRHFDHLARPVLKGICDITTSIRSREAWYGLLSGFATAYTGERAMKRKLILKNIDLFDNQGYIVESEFNRWFLGKIRMRGILWAGVGQHGQPQKNGWHGWLVNWRQLTSCLKHLGLFEMLRQLILVKLPGFALTRF